MYLEQLQQGLLGSRVQDPFSTMRQQGAQALQNGMQARDAIAGQRANAMQAVQQQQAEQARDGSALLNLGLSLATGGLGGAATGAAEASASTIGNAITDSVADAAGNAVADMAKNGISQLSTALSPVASAGLTYLDVPFRFGR